MNCAPVERVDARAARDISLRRSRTAIHEAGAISVMASYNEIDGVPSHANRWLLRDVLRKEWGFNGFVVSDYYAIWELSDRPDTHGHHVAARQARGLRARRARRREHRAARAGLLSASRRSSFATARSRSRELDDLVAPMLLLEIQAGTVRRSVRRSGRGRAHRRLRRAIAQLALQAARETITLLKNDGDLLPLDLGALKTIAVIGPNANRSLLGGYSGVPKHDVTVLDGIRARVGDHAKVLYSEGCKITRRRLVERGRGRRRAIPTRIAGRSPRRSKVAQAAPT